MWREHLPAQTEVEGQARVGLPVILHVQRGIVLLRAVGGNAGLGQCIGSTQQEIRESCGSLDAAVIGKVELPACRDCAIGGELVPDVGTTDFELVMAARQGYGVDEAEAGLRVVVGACSRGADGECAR